MEQSKIIETSKRYIYALKKTQNLTTTELQQSLEERKELYRNDKDFVYAMTILNDEKKYLISQGKTPEEAEQIVYEDQAMYQILQEQEEKNKVTQELVALVAGNTEAEKEMRNICGSYSLSELLQVKDAIQVDGDDFVIGGKVKFRKMFEISGKVKKQEKQYSDTDRSKYIDKEYRKIQYQDMYQTWELLKEMLKPFKIRENNLWKRWKEEGDNYYDKRKECYWGYGFLYPLCIKLGMPKGNSASIEDTSFYFTIQNPDNPEENIELVINSSYGNIQYCNCNESFPPFCLEAYQK